MGYSGSEQFGYEGPNAFAVVNGVVYLLDNVNRRIIVWNGNNFSSIDISACPRAKHMRYQDGRIGVIDNNTGVTGIYSTTGDLIVKINHPEVILDEFASRLLEVGTTYVVWQTYEGNCYRYDWTDNVTESVDNTMVVNQLTDDVASVSSVDYNMEWRIETEDKEINILDVSDQSVCYYQFDIVPDVDMLFMELSIHKIDGNSNETYAFIDFSDWHTSALEPFYLAEDGKVYVLECFEECAVISEVLLGTTGVSQMAELERQAAQRRLEVSTIDTEYEKNATGNSVLSISRQEALNRARAMAELTWTVKAGNKVEPSGYENVVRIPDSVLNTATNGTYTGIPYCWGGSHGLDNLDMGSSFTSLVSSGTLAAGNVITEGNTHKPGTIGLDCSGFAMSAYKISGSKMGTASFASFGYAIDKANLELMDYLVKSLDHMVLVSNSSDGCVVVYEAHVWGEVIKNLEYVDGKVEKTEALLTKYNEYSFRTPFCTSCDKAGAIQIYPEGHVFICSKCGDKWPVVAHLYVNDVCSVCGYINN